MPTARLLLLNMRYVWLVVQCGVPGTAVYMLLVTKLIFSVFPSSLNMRRLESGSDYAIYVKDQSSDAEHTSSTFTIIGSTATNVEVTSPDG